MATPLAHTLIGFIFYRDLKKSLFASAVYSLAFITFFSNFPDYDFLWGLIRGDLTAGHRLASHSLMLALSTGLATSGIAWGLWKKFVPFGWIAAFLVTLHLMVDYLCLDPNPTNGTGVPLFWPFWAGCFNFPFHPIAARFFTSPPHLPEVLVNDLFYVALFSLVLMGRTRLSPAHG